MSYNSGPPPPPYAGYGQPPPQQSQQQQYAPPAGPPPGHVGPELNAGAAGSTPPVYPPPGSNNPYNNSNAPQQPLSAMGSGGGSSYPGMVSSPITGAPPAGPGPQRTGSIQSHAQRMNSLSSGAGGSSQSKSTENPLTFLSTFDTIFIVDDSGSMHVNERKDGSMGKSRWEEARDALAGLVEIVAPYDDDGIDVHFLNSFECLENCRDPGQVRALFERVDPNGITPIGEKIEMLMLAYLDAIEDWKAGKRPPGQREPKRRNFIIITDGAASDDPESVIVSIARRLDAGNFPLSQLGIQFVQVGDDGEATEFLVELDDALSKEHRIRDMVDTVTYSGLELSPDSLVKAALGAVNRKYDRKKQ